MSERKVSEHEWTPDLCPACLNRRLEKVERENDLAVQRALDAEARLDDAKDWRDKLWDEVHRIGGPRKAALVELGRDLDVLVGFRPSQREAAEKKRRAFHPPQGERCTCEKCGAEQEFRTCCGNCGHALGFSPQWER